MVPGVVFLHQLVINDQFDVLGVGKERESHGTCIGYWEMRVQVDY